MTVTKYSARWSSQMVNKQLVYPRQAISTMPVDAPDYKRNQGPISQTIFHRDSKSIEIRFAFLQI